MSAQAGRTAAPSEAVNEVRTVGRISAAPVERTLPSGDTVWTFRIVVSRPEQRGGARQVVDALECAVGPVGSVARWRHGRSTTWSRCLGRSAGGSSGRVAQRRPASRSR